MVQSVRSVDRRLPPSTAILSNVALALLMWNLALRLGLIVANWAALPR